MEPALLIASYINVIVRREGIHCDCAQVTQLIADVESPVSAADALPPGGFLNGNYRSEALPVFSTPYFLRWLRLGGSSVIASR